MKKIIPVITLMIFVWGCSKKMAPSNAGATAPASQNMPEAKNAGNIAEPENRVAILIPTENTGTFGSKVAPKETTPEAAAAISGQSIYNAKCGLCHGLKVAADYTAEQWASILSVMAPRARLTDTEKENVYAYVKANAKK